MSSLKCFQQKLKNREPVLGTGILNSAFTGLMELYKHSELDFVLFDCEHGTINDVTIEGMLRTCRLLDLPSIVRVPGLHQVFVSRPLDLGADGIMLPHVDTVEQLERAIKYYRFAPRGYKGIGGLAQRRPGESIEEINDNRILAIQIESRQGAENLDEMLRKHGHEIGFVLIGPFDLSIDLGVAGDIVSEIGLNVVDDVSRTCARHGTSMGMFCGSKEIMQFWKDRGVNVFWVTYELELLMEEIKRVGEAFHALQ